MTLNTEYVIHVLEYSVLCRLGSTDPAGRMGESAVVSGTPVIAEET